MLTLTFIILVYSVLLNNSDLNIIKATAQRWMLNGTAGIRYQIVFAPKAFIKKISIDEIWINNRLYKVSSLSSSAIAIEMNNTDAEMVLSVDLKEEAEQTPNLVAEQRKKFMPGDVPIGTRDVVLVYNVAGKKKYHIIPKVEKLPFAIGGNFLN